MTMPVTKRSNLDEKRRDAEKASEEQMNDLYAAISGLGSSSHKNSNSLEIEKSVNPSRGGDNFKTVSNAVTQNSLPQEEPAENASETKDDKPGYVSLVIPNSLKKKWKLYSAQHEMSLTDCLKLGMKLLEQMENQGKIKIEEGFLTING